MCPNYHLNHGACVEEMVATKAWRKSMRCESGACVEVATGGPQVGLRNSTLPEVELALDAASWRQFIEGVRGGEFDLPS
jgi:hypothetical protein